MIEPIQKPSLKAPYSALKAAAVARLTAEDDTLAAKRAGIEARKVPDAEVEAVINTNERNVVRERITKIVSTNALHHARPHRAGLRLQAAVIEAAPAPGRRARQPQQHNALAA